MGTVYFRPRTPVPCPAASSAPTHPNALRGLPMQYNALISNETNSIPDTCCRLPIQCTMHDSMVLCAVCSLHIVQYRVQCNKPTMEASTATISIAILLGKLTMQCLKRVGQYSVVLQSMALERAHSYVHCDLIGGLKMCQQHCDMHFVGQYNVRLHLHCKTMVVTKNKNAGRVRLLHSANELTQNPVHVCPQSVNFD